MKYSGKGILNRLHNIFFGELSEHRVKSLLIYFMLISVWEVLAYLEKGFISMIASRSWVFTGLVCLAGVVVYFLKTLIQDLKEKQYLSIAAIFLLMLFLFYLAGNINLSDINPDATQQAAAGLNSYKSGDYNYTGKAFLGYPSRQYLIAAWPALLFGRSILTLHMGFAFPFLLGVILMYCALRKWVHRKNLSPGLAVLPLYALFVFPFVTEYYTNFEQAIYPISFTMLAIGFYLLLLCEPNVINMMGLAWIGCLFSNSYTPGLASLGLLLVFVALSAYGLLKKPEKMPFDVPSPRLAAKSLWMVDINVVVFFLATLLDKRQDRLTELRSDTSLIKLTYQSITDFLTDKNAVFFGMFGMIVIIYLVAGLTFRFKLRDFLLSLWILGVFVATYLLAGYTSYEPAWIMQRALIVIPVIIVAVTLTVFDLMSKYNVKLRNGVAAAILVSFALVGIYNFNQINQSFTYFNKIQPMKYMWSDLEAAVKENGLDAESQFNLILYTDSILMKNPADYCKFFYPNAKVYTPEQGAWPSDLDTGQVTFVYGEDEFADTLPIDLQEVKRFEDGKYDMTVTWYKGVIERN
ncbi:MAG TPA: hypothetical protein VN258_04500 [Mobilitalea sp.]|nr:hypothetical protein [Mobilitalea sp.]